MIFEEILFFVVNITHFVKELTHDLVYIVVKIGLKDLVLDCFYTGSAFSLKCGVVSCDES